jgi:UDP-N-acetylglucosamine diphosphorylase/glucosamine-1-phosphate N-acetyltransferase
MKMVILAAGEGKRMRPLTANKPKVMVPIANRPLAEHLLLEAREAGIREFIFVVGYGGEHVRAYFGSGKKWGVAIDYAEQRRQLGTADALRNLKHMINGPFLVGNGDIIVGRQDIECLAASERPTLSVIEVAKTEGLGIVELDGDRVVAIHEKPEKPPSRLANAALYYLTPGIFDAIEKTEKSVRGEYELPTSLKILGDGPEGLYALKLSAWTDVSYPWDLLEANRAILENLEPEKKGEVEERVTLRGPVAIGEGTRVRSGAYIEGPVVIGDNCDIGPNCFIRPSTAIGDGCHIGAAVEVKNSVIMNGSKIPHFNYVGDSVIGENCNLGAGTKIANLRLDKRNIRIRGLDTGRRKLGAILGDGVQTGINVSINVGCVIGNNVFIGPGRAVSGDIQSNTRYC